MKRLMVIVGVLMSILGVGKVFAVQGAELPWPSYNWFKESRVTTEPGVWEVIYLKIKDGKWTLLKRGAEIGSREEAEELKALVQEDESIEKLIWNKKYNYIFLNVAGDVETCGLHPNERGSSQNSKLIAAHANDRSMSADEHFRKSAALQAQGTHSAHCGCKKGLENSSRETEGYTLCTSNFTKTTGIGAVGAVTSLFFAPLTGGMVIPKEIDQAAITDALKQADFEKIVQAESKGEAVEVQLVSGTKNEFAYLDGNAVVVLGGKCESAGGRTEKSANTLSCRVPDGGWIEISRQGERGMVIRGKYSDDLGKTQAGRMPLAGAQGKWIGEELHVIPN